MQGIAYMSSVAVAISTMISGWTIDYLKYQQTDNSEPYADHEDRYINKKIQGLDDDGWGY